MNYSCIVGALTNIENHIHKQPDPEQLHVAHTNICSVRGSNPRHAAQQSVIQPLRQPCRYFQFQLFSGHLIVDYNSLAMGSISRTPHLSTSCLTYYI